MISETLEAIATNLENAYNELENKGAIIPESRNIQNLADAIASIQGGGGGDDMVLYHITQTINGDNCTLSFTTYNGEETDNYWVGTKTVGNNQELFIVGENGGASLARYHIEQVITGNNCVLNFTTYTNQEEDNYWVYTLAGSDTQSLIVFGGGDGGGSSDEMKLYYIEQTISGNNCTLSLTDNFVEGAEQCWVGTKTNGNNQEIFIVCENDVSKYHIEQVISGRNCVLNFTTYTNQPTDNYWVRTNVIGDDQYIWLTDDSGQTTLITKTITSNGTYNAQATDGADGYSEVVVNVSGGANLGTKTITMNGTYDAEDDGLDGFSSVTVNVSGGGTNMMPAYINARGGVANLFYGASSITAQQVEQIMTGIDTSSYTVWDRCFEQCASITTMPNLNYTNATYCTALFGGCGFTTLTVTGFANLQIAEMLFGDNYNLTSITFSGALSTTNSITNIMGMFQNCPNLVSITGLNCENVDSAWWFLGDNPNIETLEIYGIGVDFDISASTAYSTASLQTIIANLADISITPNVIGENSATLTMGATNLAKLSQSDIDDATAKGWTLV